MITKPDIEMFHHGFWKSIYFGVKRQVHEAQKTELALFVALL